MLSKLREPTKFLTRNNRLERYLTICNASKVSPIIVLSKTDLINEHRTYEILEDIKTRIKNVPIIPISNKSLDGFDKIKTIIEKGKTYCMLGSSGAGKSTLINNFMGETIMRTDKISQSTNKGRHVTSHRELVILENGGIKAYFESTITEKRKKNKEFGKIVKNYKKDRIKNKF